VISESKQARDFYKQNYESIIDLVNKGKKSQVQPERLAPMSPK